MREKNTWPQPFWAFIDVQETFTYYKFDKIQAIFEIVKFFFVQFWAGHHELKRLSSE
jgi:hypothetical protein